VTFHNKIEEGQCTWLSTSDRRDDGLSSEYRHTAVVKIGRIGCHANPALGRWRRRSTSSKPSRTSEFHIIVLGRLRQEDWKFEASLSYIRRPFLKNKNKSWD
jgi:hypothetical protein